MKVTIANIEEAKRVLAEHLEPSPMLRNPWLSKKYECDVYLKLENMQPVGSFKIRGATYKISQLTKKERAKGVVASSAGNHAQGVAWAAAQFKTKATIVMPKNAPITKVQNTQSLGAKVVLEGDDYEGAYQYARKIERKTGAIFVHAFEDEKVISGQGTMGLEILEQLPDVGVVIGALGGGGMMAGVGTVFKEMKPATVIVGAQASGARAMVESIQKKKIIQNDRAETFADGIKVKTVRPSMFQLLKKTVDIAMHADDESIAAGVLVMMEKARVIAEGAGALPVAILDKIYRTNKKLVRGKKVVLIVCGGNIDVNVLGRIIDRGLILTGRRVRLNVFVSDKPGSLNALTQLIAKMGGNILQAIHDRDAPAVGLHETGIEMAIETRGTEHSNELVAAIKKRFPKIEVFR